jgi:transcriptional regulator with XRE-family HTH domain
MAFGETLRRIRREKRVTQSALGEAIGMDTGYLSRLENDKFDYKPSRETVEKISTNLKCTPAEHAELLAEAGRIDKEVEKAARLTNERPELRELFSTAPGLTPESVRLLVELAKKRKLAEQKNSKTGGR